MEWTRTAAVEVMGDPACAAESCQKRVHDRCKMLHIHTQTAGESSEITEAPEGLKGLF